MSKMASENVANFRNTVFIMYIVYVLQCNTLHIAHDKGSSTQTPRPDMKTAKISHLLNFF